MQRCGRLRRVRATDAVVRVGGPPLAAARIKEEHVEVKLSAEIMIAKRGMPYQLQRDGAPIT